MFAIERFYGGEGEGDDGSNVNHHNDDAKAKLVAYLARRHGAKETIQSSSSSPLSKVCMPL